MPKLPRGLSRDAKGWRIRIGPGGSQFRKRFPASKTLEEMKAELEKIRPVAKAGRSGPLRGTIDGDLIRYFEHYFGTRAGRKERQRHLKLWRDALGGETWRSKITREDVSRILQGWKTSGLSADTCNKRRTALLAFYNALDGKAGKNPVRDVPKFRVSPPLARGLPMPLVEKALRKLPRCRTRARLKLIAFTGARPAQIMRLTPDDWDDKAKTLLLKATEKGAGTKPHRVPLSDQAQAAMREFDNTDAWGTFTLAPMGRMWKAAAISVGLPKDTRVYDLRHTFGTELYRTTGDVKVTKDLMGHSSLTMTERYTLAAVPIRQQQAIALLNQGRKSGDTGKKSAPRGKSRRKTA